MKFKPLALKISLKKIVASLLFSLFLSGCNETVAPIQGVQYRLLPETLNSNNFSPVTEVFSLTCIHCRQMEDLIPALQRSIGQKITKLHVAFNQPAYIASMFYYAAEMQTGAIPDYYFLVDLFTAMQLPESSSDEAFQKAMIEVFESRGLISPINYNDQQFEALSKRVDDVSRLSDKTQIQSVPTFIVRGKYQVIASAHDSKQELAETIKYLLAKKS
ncbi:thioredoxin domain-containing protein [Psychromonas marina]|nr:thioredoxin domain-containing protein [Psychromonas marina]